MHFKTQKNALPLQETLAGSKKNLDETYWNSFSNKDMCFYWSIHYCSFTEYLMVPNDTEEALLCWSLDLSYQKRDPTQNQCISSWKKDINEKQALIRILVTRQSEQWGTQRRCPPLRAQTEKMCVLNFIPMKTHQDSLEANVYETEMSCLPSCLRS